MKYFFIKIGLSVFGIFSIVAPVKGQTIKTDGTTDTQLTPTDNGIRIDNGNRSGGNLFHSFEEFSVTNGTEAFFNNDMSINNIFNRVTGSSISNIDGMIRANGNANVFLLNPNGIIFGKGATLNIGGSFIGTTADSIVFPDGEFTALDSNNPPLITINAPIGLNLRDNPEPIQVNGLNFDLTLDNFFTQGVTLVGGDINIDTQGQLGAFGGTLQFGGLKESGEVTFNLDNNRPSLGFSDNLIKADVLIENSFINVQSGGGGEIKIDANNVTLENSILFAGINFNMGTGQAGNIIINADNLVSINGANLENRNPLTNKIEPFFSGISNNINKDFQGNINEGSAGNIEINTKELKLTNGARIIAFNEGIGDLGNITINATDNVVIKGIADTNQRRSTNDNGFSAIFNTIGEKAIGDGGNIEIDTTNLEVSEGGQIITNNFRGTGDVGDVIITAKGLVDIRGIAANQLNRTLITSFINEPKLDDEGKIINSIGNAGNIIIKESSTEDSLTVNIADGAILTTSTFGEGNPGNVSIQADEINILGQGITRDILPNGNETGILSSGITSIVERGAVTNTNLNEITGSINITTKSLNLQDGGVISSNNLGQGIGGNITIESDSLLVEGTTSNFQFPSGLFSRVGENAVGDGGNIDINVDRLEVKDGGQIRTGTQGQGNAGNITINGRDTGVARLVIFDGQKMFNRELNPEDNIIFTGSGNIQQPFFTEENGTVIIPSVADSSVLANAMGNGGQITIKAESLEILNNALLTASSNNTRGEAGGIIVEANSLKLNNGNITAETNFISDLSNLNNEAMKENSNISLDIDDTITLRGNSLISARATGENATGGNIFIDSKFLIAFPTNNDIVASSEGQGGNIALNVREKNGGILGVFKSDRLNNSTNDINVSGSEERLDGNVTISIPDVGIVEDLATLDENVIDRETTLTEGCKIDRDSEDKENRLTINKLSGKPYNPGEPIAEDDIITVPTKGDLINSQHDREPIVINNIVLARGMIKNPDGSISLVSYPTSNTNHSRTPNNTPNCNLENNKQ